MKRKKEKGKNEGEAGRKGWKGVFQNAKAPEKFSSGVTLFSSFQTRSLNSYPATGNVKAVAAIILSSQEEED